MSSAAQAQRSIASVRRKKTDLEIRIERSKSVAIVILSVALLLFTIVFLAAYSADLQQKNNQLTAENREIQAEIDSLTKQIDDATNIETIEKVATEELGMVQPDESNYITLKDDTDKDYNLAATIKEEAYD